MPYWKVNLAPRRNSTRAFLFNVSSMHKGNQTSGLLNSMPMCPAIRYLAGQIESVVELSLTANQRKADMRKPLEWRVEGEESGASPKGVGQSRTLKGSTVELSPMQIRTFAVYVT